MQVSIHLSINLVSYAGSFRDLCDLQVVLWEGRKFTCYLRTTKVVPATLWQPSQVTKRRVTRLTRNAMARSMRYTVPNILACQCQPVVSGGHTDKAVSKATLTDRCSSCLYILLLYVWHIWQRQPSWSRNPVWPDVFTVISKFWTSFLTPRFPNTMLRSLGTLKLYLIRQCKIACRAGSAQGWIIKPCLAV